MSDIVDSPESKLVDTKGAAKRLLLAPVTLEMDRCTRRLGIPFRKHGRRVVYHVDELDAWSLQRRVGAPA